MAKKIMSSKQAPMTPLGSTTKGGDRKVSQKPVQYKGSYTSYQGEPLDTATKCTK